MESFHAPTKGGLLIRVKVIPQASKTGAAGVRNGELVVKLGAAPKKGKANKELVAWLADALACSKSEIVLLTGETDRHKTLRVPERCEGTLSRLETGK